MTSITPTNNIIQDQGYPTAPRLALRVLVAFLFTFLAARILVLLIMLRSLPDLFLYVGGTHVHHLNYGIFLLSATGAVTLFFRLTDKHRQWAAVAYGVGLGLTFDEFGMWLHLGGGYWQRASYDGVVTVAALLALISVSPALPRFHSIHWTLTVALLATLGTATWLAYQAAEYAGIHLRPLIESIETAAPRE